MSDNAAVVEEENELAVVQTHFQPELCRSEF